MAKELPFFKFEPSQWENGNIQLCSFEEQGVFINICSMYWQRLGDLPYKLAVQKVCNGNATALDSLCDEHVVKVIDGMICIDFLNEQLSEFGNISKINSDNARSGWEKRRLEAEAMRPHNDRNAIREEKKREEKRKEEETTAVADVLPFGSDQFAHAWNEWLLYKKEKKQKLTQKTKEMQLRTLGARPESEAIGMIGQSIQNGWTGLFEYKDNKNGKQVTAEGTLGRFNSYSKRS